MESLQKMILKKLLLQGHNEILKRLLLGTVDFNKLTEYTLGLIFAMYGSNIEITDKVPDHVIIHFVNGCMHCDVFHNLLPNGCPYMSDEESTSDEEESMSNTEEESEEYRVL